MYLYSIYLGLKRGSYIVALGPKYILCRYMDPLGLGGVEADWRKETPESLRQRADSCFTQCWGESGQSTLNPKHHRPHAQQKKKSLAEQAGTAMGQGGRRRWG